MTIIVAIVLAAFRLILSVLYFLLIIRAIMSWIPGDMGKLGDFVYGVTEPVLSPVRELFDKVGGRSFMPIDLSFLAVMLVITLLLNII